MENTPQTWNGNGIMDNGHKVSLAWLDLKVFYVRVHGYEIDDSTPELLSVRHTPLWPDTVLEVNGVRAQVNSSAAPVVLRRERFDRKSEEATFVGTDSVRTNGSLEFQVFDRSMMILSGTLELCCRNGHDREFTDQVQNWRLNCELDLSAAKGIFKGKEFTRSGSTSPMVEVYLAGLFSGSPIVLTKILQLCMNPKQGSNENLGSVPENSTTGTHETTPLQTQYHKSDYEVYNQQAEYFEGEDGELSWFNAGVRVGVGIGLSICLGVGIGVGLLIQTYQGTARSFRRRSL